MYLKKILMIFEKKNGFEELKKTTLKPCYKEKACLTL